MQTSMFMIFYTVAENSDTSYHDQQEETKNEMTKRGEKNKTKKLDCTQPLHHYTPLYDTHVIIILWGMLVKYEGSK